MPMSTPCAAGLHVSAISLFAAETNPRRSLSRLVVARRGVCNETSLDSTELTATGPLAAKAPLGRMSSVSANTRTAAKSATGTAAKRRWPKAPKSARRVSAGAAGIKKGGGCRRPDIPLWSQGAVVMSARNISRSLTVLLLAGLWALGLAFSPATTRLSEDHVVESLGQSENGHSQPATETLNFGAPEPEASVDGDAVLTCACLPVFGASVVVEPALAERSADGRRYNTVRSARGPPTRA
jgi:hypothetical protein